MRVLITGIDGFVGSHAAEFLLRIPGVEVHGTVLDPASVFNIEHIRHSLHLHKANLLEPDRIVSLFREVRPERVIHLAGQAYVPAAFADPLPTFQANIIGGVHILEAVRHLKAGENVSPSVLIVSTGEVYGRTDRLPITEQFPLAPNNPYAASKAGIDIIAQQYGGAFGLRVIVVRPFNHAGPRQNPIFVCSDFAKQVAEISLGRREAKIHVGNLEARRDFTDVRDVIRAYWALLEKNASGVYNVCSGKTAAIQEILDMLVRVSNTRIECITEQNRMRSYDIPVIYGSNEKLGTATGWSPEIPLDQTLRDVYEYWRQQIS